jgi:mannose-6-phosphate isomerase-like protein (cupin superfamily)
MDQPTAKILPQVGSIDAAFESFQERWRPKVAATLNGQEVRVVKVEGEFPWHSHPDAEEMFLVWMGRLQIDFRDHTVWLTPGEYCVVPKGLEHKTSATSETWVVLFEPAETVNTGDAPVSEFTAPMGLMI